MLFLVMAACCLHYTAAFQPATATVGRVTTSLGPTARNGLSWEDVEVGTGRRVNAGDAILCYYEGTFKTGSGPFAKTVTFDSTDPGEPIELVVGKGQVIPGWDLGILGDLSLEIPPMTIGGDRKLKIPPALAYGSDGVGPIPPNQELEFQIEIVNAQATGGVSAGTQMKGFAGLFAFLATMALVGFVILQNVL